MLCYAIEKWDVVNMTYKYLYIFNDTLQLNIDFRNCDCPWTVSYWQNLKQKQFGVKLQRKYILNVKKKLR